MRCPSFSRRDVLRIGAAAVPLALGAASGPARRLRAAETRVGANDRIRVGVIGTGVRGKYLIGNLPPTASVGAICDCAQSRIAGTLQPEDAFRQVLARFREVDAGQCAVYQDYRQLFDSAKLDAVIIATPDHHHVHAAMLALQAGLDVYLEKPLTVTIAEGRRLAAMVAGTGRVLQVGSQQRTMEMNRFACQFIRDGGLGRVTRVELPNYPGPLVPGDLPEEPVPQELDWDLFCGPAPLRPYHRRLWIKDAFKVGDLLWRGWDLWRDYSGHMMTNWGAHSVDMVQYALGRDASGPVEIRAVAVGDVRPLWQAWQDKTPLTEDRDQHRFWPVMMRYDDGVQLQFNRNSEFIHFYGERGVLRMRRNGFETDPPDLISRPPDPRLAEPWQGDGHVARPHLQNWLDCIQSRSVPNAPVEAGHRTATVCHLANIARQLRRPLRWDPQRERFVDDAEADGLLDRPRRDGWSEE